MAKLDTPDIGVDKRSNEYKEFLEYLEGDDGEQFEIMRRKWAKLNWDLMSKAEGAVAALEKGKSTATVSPIILAAGVGFDKLYAKRPVESTPLSFPSPLLSMVQRGFKERKKEAVSDPSIQTLELVQTNEPALVEHAVENAPEVATIDPGEALQKKRDKENGRNQARRELRQQRIKAAVESIQRDVPWQSPPQPGGVL